MINSDFVKKRVVIYARVSTEHEAQISALENQVDWYKPILEARPDWTLVGQYIDEGITGTSAEKRPQFMKMIADAKAIGSKAGVGSTFYVDLPEKQESLHTAATDATPSA